MFSSQETNKQPIDSLTKTYDIQIDVLQSIIDYLFNEKKILEAIITRQALTPHEMSSAAKDEFEKHPRLGDEDKQLIFLQGLLNQAFSGNILFNDDGNYHNKDKGEEILFFSINSSGKEYTFKLDRARSCVETIRFHKLSNIAEKLTDKERLILDSVISTSKPITLENANLSS